MNILEELNRSSKLFYDKLEMSLNYVIDKYSSYFDETKKERRFILEDLVKDLEKISNLLDNYGYTYYPSNVEDVSEDVFEEIVMRYLNSFKSFIDNGDSNIETINVNVKTLMTLVDKHKIKSEHFV